MAKILNKTNIKSALSNINNLEEDEYDDDFDFIMRESFVKDKKAIKINDSDAKQKNDKKSKHFNKNSNANNTRDFDVDDLIKA